MSRPLERRAPLVIAAVMWAALSTPAVPVTPANPPNVVMIFIDTLRADHVHCYGYPRETTPNLDRLAARGTLFENCIAQASWSLPSYATILTSLYPPSHTVDEGNTFIDDSLTTLPEIFSRCGYETAGFTAGGHASELFGVDQGFSRFESRPHFGSFYHSVPRAISWLQQPRSKPFFVFVHGYDVHFPWNPPLGYAELFDPGYQGLVHTLDIFNAPDGERRLFGRAFHGPTAFTAWDGPGWPGPGQIQSLPSVPMTTADLDHVTAHYDGAVAYADAWVGTLMAACARMQLDRDTIFVIAADHGEELGEHGLFTHGRLELRSLLHVPLIVVGPGIASGRRVPDVVELVDLGPTLLELASLVPHHEHQGRSLAPFLTGENPPTGGEDRVAFSTSGPSLSAMTRRWHLIVHNDGRKVLFDLSTDPDELDDVAAGNPQIVNRLNQQLLDWLERTERPTIGKGSRLTSSEKDFFRKRGYW